MYKPSGYWICNTLTLVSGSYEGNMCCEWAEMLVGHTA